MGVVVDVERYGAEGGDLGREGGEVVVVLSAGGLLLAFLETEAAVGEEAGEAGGGTRLSRS